MQYKIKYYIFFLITLLICNFSLLLGSESNNEFTDQIDSRTKTTKFENSPKINKPKILADTSSYGNKIERVWNNGQIFLVKLLITNFKDRPIRLSLVNLIGKEVKVVYEGIPKDSNWEYTFSYSDIPSGVYLCVLSSSEYRDAKKIVITR